ncbi:MAG: ribbon-helix-helix protein, CopG family [Acidobacteria bacterium]|nr:ribbon-helix-helix protein, CopG family [Acidobacteriota bacterium]
MRRTQLYLDEQLWNALHAQAKTRRTTVSELVREAVRDRYLGSLQEREQAMRQFIGSRLGGVDADAVEEVRELRRGSRLDRLETE